MGQTLVTAGLLRGVGGAVAFVDGQSQYRFTLEDAGVAAVAARPPSHTLLVADAVDKTRTQVGCVRWEWRGT